MALIGHIDADCFYASAERVRRPGLKGVPVGVLGNQGACVIAKSYEMKANGVKTGMPIWDAVTLCPDGVYVKRDFRWYEVLSRAMLEIIRETSPTVEYYSIDEMFFDATGIDTHALQQRVLSETGVPASIGVSHSRTLAKLASDARKPFGCTVIVDGDVDLFVENIPVIEVTGIALQSSIMLASHGIRTVGEFRRADPKLINRLLTKTGESLWWELNGKPIMPIEVNRPMHKRIARGGSVGRTTSDRERLIGWIVRNVERLVEAMYWHRYVTRKLSVRLTYKTGGGWSGRTALITSTAASEILIPAAKDLFTAGWSGQPVSHIHIVADELEIKGHHQQSLFNPQNPELDDLKRTVNDKLGRFAIRSAETLAINDIYTDEAYEYDICDIHGKSCF
ncbi:MAG: DNA polymerase IV [Planctomycetaceae bacterium]|nr:DNA polymerase IV [Planctomycetaceae bacterium]